MYSFINPKNNYESTIQDTNSSISESMIYFFCFLLTCYRTLATFLWRTWGSNAVVQYVPAPTVGRLRCWVAYMIYLHPKTQLRGE